MNTAPSEKTAILLVGPTGVGKTYLSTLIAGRLDVEIVSADSRQIYKYMDIGTAKPPAEVLDAVRHHFIDMLKPDQPYNSGQFGEEAREVVAQILDREKIPLIVGGSGLYIRSLLEGFWGEDVRDEHIRTSLQHRLETEGAAALHQDLEKIDPEAAKKIHRNNSQRILRALEVYLVSGHSITQLQKKKSNPLPFNVIKFGLTMDRKKLYRYIDERVDRMFRDGLLAEAAKLLEMGYTRYMNALNTVGYKEVFQFLEGEIGFEECADLVKRNSRRYAKRQFTWFRADKEISWLEVNEPEDFEQAADTIVRSYQKQIGAAADTAADESEANGREESSGAKE